MYRPVGPAPPITPATRIANAAAAAGACASAEASTLQHPPRRAAIDAAKARPYLPSGKKRPRANLNGSVDLGAPHLLNGPLECRHFAVEYATAGTKKAKVLEVFSNPDNIALHFGSLREGPAIEDAVVAATARIPPDAKHLIKANRLGRYLAHVAERLEATGGSEANVVLLSSVHVMALHVQRKQRKAGEANAGASYFAVKLYDPNRTSNHTRVEVASPRALEGLRFKDLNRDAPVHVEGGSQGHLMAACQDLALSMPQAELASSVNGQALFLALTMGLCDALDATAATLRAIPGPLPQEALAELLSAPADGIAPPALNVSMQLSGPGVIRSYAALLRVAVDRLRMAPQRLTELLKAETHAGVPALHAGMACGNAHTLREFGPAVAQFALPRSTTIELLAARDADGITALYASSRDGHAEVVHAYADMLHALGDQLRPREKADLFIGRGPNDETACQVAEREGHVEVVRAHQARQAEFHD
jgi:ShET2 enterotoxin, N-terminal region